MCRSDDATGPPGAAIGTDVDDPIRPFCHDVEIVLDDEHRVAGVDEVVQHFQK